jgi:pantoate--beta-alanine ligase
MRIIRSRSELATQRAQWRTEGEHIGVVPTMGSLHNGHLALVNALDGKATRRIVSVFVNPIQFNNLADFEHYPRGLDADAAVLEGTGKVDVLYAPDEAEMYPPGFATRITVAGADAMLCGAERPGHFDGVATVVSKLLLQTGADVAAFGEKDYQQLCLIRRLVCDLDLPVNIVPVPTVREADGLALSSRNRRLSAAQRKQATHLPAALHACIADIKTGRPVADSLQTCRDRLTASGFNVHYLELRTGDTLEQTSTPQPDARLFVAASLGDIRLIDNMPLHQT